MVVKYTHEDRYRDENNRQYHNGHCGYEVEWNKNEIDLDHYAGGPGLNSFYLMVGWCIDNCNDKWALHWNEEMALFDDESDALAFKLRWM